MSTVYSTLPRIKELILADFLGGLNLRDSASQIASNETPDAMNATVTERGGVESRLGFSKWNTAGQPAAIGTIGYFSELLQKTIWQFGADMYLQTTNGSLGASVNTWTTSARAAYVDFAGFVYAVHPVDGVERSTDGTTWNAVATGPDGDTIAVWQNKLWIGGDPAQRPRLYFCAPGDGNVWSGSGAGTVDLREVNDAAIKAVHTGPTEGLLAYKEEAAHRVYDSTTGAYQTLSNRYGAVDHKAVRTAFGRAYSACLQGVFVTDGLSPLVSVSEKVRPIFTERFLAPAQKAKWAMGFQQDRLRLSLVKFGATANNLELELHPLHGWVMAHTSAMAAYVEYSADAEKLLGIAPTVNGQIYELLDDTGTDDGADITSRFQTGWLKPGGFQECHYLRALIRGRGAPNIFTRVNQDEGPGDLQTLDMTAAGVTVAEWDSSDWDGGDSWGPGTLAEGDDWIEGLGSGRDISFEIGAVTDTTTQRPAVLDVAGQNPIVGAWGVYAIHLYFIDGGYAA